MTEYELKELVQKTMNLPNKHTQECWNNILQNSNSINNVIENMIKIDIYNRIHLENVLVEILSKIIDIENITL